MGNLVTKLRCKNCGRINNREATLCVHCGYNIKIGSGFSYKGQFDNEKLLAGYAFYNLEKGEYQTVPVENIFLQKDTKEESKEQIKNDVVEFKRCPVCHSNCDQTTGCLLLKAAHKHMVLTELGTNEIYEVEFDSQNRFVIGRETVNWPPLLDKKISRYQCTLSFENNEYFVEEESSQKPSLNGTFIDEKRLISGVKQIIKDGQIIRLGIKRFQINVN